MSGTTDRNRAGMLDGHRDWQIRRLWLPRHSHSGGWIGPKRVENRSRLRESAGKGEKAAEEGGTKRKAEKRWLGEGGKTTLVGAPDANILREAIEELRKRTTAGAATFLVKVKAHRGEPAKEKADIQDDKDISGKDVSTEWRDRTNLVC